MRRARILILCLFITTTAFLTESRAQDADEDQGPKLNGDWALKDVESGRAFGLRIIQKGQTFTGVYLNVREKKSLGISDGIEIIRGKIQKNTLKGTITTRINVDGKIYTKNCALTLHYKGKHQDLTGQYKYHTFSKLKKTWRAKADRQVKLIPACKPIRGKFTLGRGNLRVVVELSEKAEHVPFDKDEYRRPGYCRYETIGLAKLALQLGDSGPLAPTVTIAKGDLSFYKKMGADQSDSKAYQGVSFYWSDSGGSPITLFNKFGLSFHLDSASVTFNIEKSGAITLSESVVVARLEVAKDVHLGGPVYVNGDLTAYISYRWTEGARSWASGTWSFTGLADVQFQIRRDGLVPIATLDLAVNDQGEIEAMLKLTANKTWRIGAFQVSLQSSSLRARLSLKTGEWTLLGGSLVGQLSSESPIDGQFSVALTWQDGTFTASLTAEKDLKVFGGTISQLALSLDLNANTLRFTRIEGSLSYKHNDFDATIDIKRILIVEGQLKEFIGAGRVGYRNFALDISELNYIAGDLGPKLQVSATLNLGWSKGGAASVEIRNFTIDQVGTISQFDISASVNASPVTIRFQARFEGREFRGTFRGQFAGNIGINGEVVIGVKKGTDQADYRYGYLGLEVHLGSGVPIAQTGLKVLALNGAFGFNYVPFGSPVAPQGGLRGDAGPRKGIYYLAGGITIGDAAGLASLNGTLALTLGVETSLQISGTLQITQRSPYFRGTLTCNYRLGQEELDGKLQTTVKVPMSGSIINIQDNILYYHVDKNGWSVNGSNLGGRFFSFITISEGQVSFKSTLDRPLEKLTGRLKAKLGGDTSVSFRSKKLGFEIRAAARISFHGSINAAINRYGPVGSFDIGARFNGRFFIASPKIRFLPRYTKTVYLSGRARLSATNQNGRLKVAGSVTLYDSSSNAYSANFRYKF